MYKDSFKNFFLAKTSHRIPKILTLAVSASILVAMVNIDASASAFGGRNSDSIRFNVVKTLESESSTDQFSGLVKRWSTVTAVAPTATPTAVAPTATTVAPPSGGGGGGGGGGGTTSSTTTTTSPPTSTTTSTSTTTTTGPSSTPSVSGGPITAGASRSECLAPDTTPGDLGLSYINSLVSSWDSLTNSTVTCLLSYLNGAPNWAAWESPWITQDQFGYTDWVKQAPQTRSLVLQVDLIPDSLENVNDPLSWEQSCAAGNFNAYATQLGNNLVAAGLQNSVIRLGAEMNGAWEADYIGNTTQEQNLWAQCFANEVTGMRQASGENFLFDWNPNACTQNEPYSAFYPGNAYVDIMGLDFYDVDCDSPSSPTTYAQLTSEPYGLAAFEAFAAAQGKPMSFPEWGLATTPNGDDPAYIDGIGATVANGNFAFEAYFDAGAGSSLPLGTNTPLSVAAFQKWFGNS